VSSTRRASKDSGGSAKHGGLVDDEAFCLCLGLSPHAAEQIGVTARGEELVHL
jgi:hypothetical protein